MENEENKPQTQSRTILWLKRLGILGFLFFLGKGLLWLSLPTILIWWNLHK